MSTNTTSDEVLDTSEMPAVHTFFRREIRLAGSALRRVADGDLRRARTVADHLDYVGRCLHHHHVAEDELVWPLLLDRVPEELVPIVTLMQSQHARLDALLHEAAGLSTAWRRTADADTRDRLAQVYDDLAVTLAEHLDAEEERLLPITARTLTAREWRAIGDQARSHTRGSEKVLTFGMIQADADPEAVNGMLRGAPAPVRLLLPVLGRMAFRRRSLLVHGSATP